MIRSILLFTMIVCSAPAAAQEVRLQTGETVRVRMRAPAELDPGLRLLTPAERMLEARLLAITTDSIFLELDVPVARILFVSIGHWTMGERLALPQLETLEVERGRFRALTPRRLGVAILGGAAAGFIISRFDWQCVNASCPNAKRDVGLLTGGLVSVVLAWPWTTEWIDVPLNQPVLTAPPRH